MPDTTLPLIPHIFSDKRGTNEQRLVILLTDGQVASLDVAAWVKALAAAEAQLMIVAPTPGPSDSPDLAKLASSTGTTRSFVDDPALWSQVLKEHVSSRVRGKLHERSISWKSPGVPPLGASADTWTQVWMKPEALLRASGEDGATQVPLAAVAQRGLGKVGAIAITDNGSQSYRELVERMIREVSAPPGDPRFSAACRRLDDGTWLITADGIGEEGFLNGESLSMRMIGDMRIATDAGVPSPVSGLNRLPQTAPGHYEARIRTDGPFAMVIHREDSRVVARLQTPQVESTEWPASVETSFQPTARDAVILPPSLDDNTAWDVPHTARIPMAAGFWILASLAGLAALFLRR